MRVEHGLEFEFGFLPLGPGLAFGDDARAGVDPDARFLRHSRADGHGEFAIQLRVDPADRRPVPAARDRLQLTDEPQRVRPRVAAQRWRGMQRLDQRQHAGWTLQPARERRLQMLDIAQLEQCRGRNCQRLGQRRQAVAHLVDHDLVLVAVFRAIQQRSAQLAVFRWAVAASDAAGQGDRRELRALNRRQQFGRRAVEGEARSRLEEEAVTLGIMRRQMLQDRQQLHALIEAQLGRARQHDFIQFAGADAAGGCADHPPPAGAAHGIVDAAQLALSRRGERRLGSAQLGCLGAQSRLELGDEALGRFVRRNLRIEGQPGLIAAAHQLIMRQHEESRRVNRPGIVGREIAAEGESAEETRAGAAVHAGPGEQLARAIGDLLVALFAPGCQFHRGAHAGECLRAARAGPVEARLAFSRRQESVKAQASARQAAA